MQCLRWLGRAANERAAIADFLAPHGESAHAPRLRARAERFRCLALVERDLPERHRRRPPSGLDGCSASGARYAAFASTLFPLLDPGLRRHGFLFLLLAAGFETTTHLLNAALVLLMDHPEVHARTRR